MLHREQEISGYENNEFESIKSLHELVEYASDKLQNPVTIEAPNFDLLSYSGNYQILDSARKDTILGKKVPLHIANYLKQEGVMKLIETSTSAIRIPSIDEIGLTVRVVVCIRDRNKVLGYIWVQEATRKLTNQEFQFLEQAAERASNIIMKNRFSRRVEAEAKEGLITKLIQGNYTNEKVLRLEAELAGVDLPYRFTVFILDFSNLQITDQYRSVIRTYCLYTSKTTYWLENGQQVLIIVGSPSFIVGSAIKLAKNLAENLSNHLKLEVDIDIKIGIGKEYEQILDMKKSYLEANEVIAIKKQFRNKVPHQYHDLGIFRFLSVIHEKYKSESYINENLLRLKKYDLENQTDFLITLEQYIISNGKMKEAADALFIHPNTLNYRIKRINEICNFNLDDINERTQLYIDLLLHYYK